ncbi:uncharacterized protein L201_003639 [Kwoniella dendrophila CBS 6074]|uniref:Polycomb protein VEFS-Box domain-containing protein n=1 Tax=Kwoniella dendrophila CBS 6074 TaxID=1295534 RepID=A0AAX4JTI7_9TREE
MNPSPVSLSSSSNNIASNAFTNNKSKDGKDTAAGALPIAGSTTFDVARGRVAATAQRIIDSIQPTNKPSTGGLIKKANLATSSSAPTILETGNLRRPPSKVTSASSNGPVTKVSPASTSIGPKFIQPKRRGRPPDATTTASANGSMNKVNAISTLSTSSTKLPTPANTSNFQKSGTSTRPTIDSSKSTSNSAIKLADSLLGKARKVASNGHLISRAEKEGSTGVGNKDKAALGDKPTNDKSSSKTSGNKSAPLFTSAPRLALMKTARRATPQSTAARKMAMNGTVVPRINSTISNSSTGKGNTSIGHRPANDAQRIQPNSISNGSKSTSTALPSAISSSGSWGTSNRTGPTVSRVSFPVQPHQSAFEKHATLQHDPSSSSSNVWSRNTSTSNPKPDSEPNSSTIDTPAQRSIFAQDALTSKLPSKRPFGEDPNTGRQITTSNKKSLSIITKEPMNMFTSRASLKQWSTEPQQVPSSGISKRQADELDSNPSLIEEEDTSQHEEVSTGKLPTSASDRSNKQSPSIRTSKRKMDDNFTSPNSQKIDRRQSRIKRPRLSSRNDKAPNSAAEAEVSRSPSPEPSNSINNSISNPRRMMTEIIDLTMLSDSEDEDEVDPLDQEERKKRHQEELARLEEAEKEEVEVKKEIESPNSKSRSKSQSDSASVSIPNSENRLDPSQSAIIENPVRRPIRHLGEVYTNRASPSSSDEVDTPNSAPRTSAHASNTAKISEILPSQPNKLPLRLAESVSSNGKTNSPAQQIDTAALTTDNRSAHNTNIPAEKQDTTQHKFRDTSDVWNTACNPNDTFWTHPRGLVISSDGNRETEYVGSRAWILTMKRLRAQRSKSMTFRFTPVFRPNRKSLFLLRNIRSAVNVLARQRFPSLERRIPVKHPRPFNVDRVRAHRSKMESNIHTCREDRFLVLKFGRIEPLSELSNKATISPDKAVIKVYGMDDGVADLLSHCQVRNFALRSGGIVYPILYSNSTCSNNPGKEIGNFKIIIELYHKKELWSGSPFEIDLKTLISEEGDFLQNPIPLELQSTAGNRIMLHPAPSWAFDPALELPQLPRKIVEDVLDINTLVSYQRSELAPPHKIEFLSDKEVGTFKTEEEIATYLAILHHGKFRVSIEKEQHDGKIVTTIISEDRFTYNWVYKAKYNTVLEQDVLLIELGPPPQRPSPSLSPSPVDEDIEPDNVEQVTSSSGNVRATMSDNGSIADEGADHSIDDDHRDQNGGRGISDPLFSGPPEMDYDNDNDPATPTTPFSSIASLLRTPQQNIRSAPTSATSSQFPGLMHQTLNTDRGSASIAAVPETFADLVGRIYKSQSVDREGDGPHAQENPDEFMDVDDLDQTNSNTGSLQRPATVMPTITSPSQLKSINSSQIQKSPGKNDDLTTTHSSSDAPTSKPTKTGLAGPSMAYRINNQYTKWSSRIDPGTLADLFPALDQVWDGGKIRHMVRDQEESVIWTRYHLSQEHRFMSCIWNRWRHQKGPIPVDNRSEYYTSFIRAYADVMIRAGLTREVGDHLWVLCRENYISFKEVKEALSLWNSLSGFQRKLIAQREQKDREDARQQKIQ